MTPDNLTVTATIDAPAPDVFAVLADPSTHADIDGTGWVREPVDGGPLDHVGQVFRMGMYHENHPDKHYEMANQVEILDAPSAISWKPGQISSDTGELSFGGWTWRYDLVPAGPEATAVTLTYDWSAVAADVRREIQFPPFDKQHLDNSLEHLAQLATPSK
jgi:Polyketide cyclase / dehydrase and lipid transport